MKKLLLPLILFFSPALWATHYGGASISWGCTANDGFIFTLDIYRNCSLSNPNYPNNLLIEGPNGKFSLTRVATQDLPRTCKNSSSATSCGTSNLTFQKLTYRSATQYFTGPIPASGWNFIYYGGSRSIIVEKGSGASGTFSVVVSTIYPDPSSSGVCHSASPSFLQDPVVRVTPRQTELLTNLAATDHPEDSLHYSFTPLLDDSINKVTSYGAGYAVDAPFPDQTENASNGPILLNPRTGTISLDSKVVPDPGMYIYALEVQSWRQGVKISQVMRELPLHISGTTAPGEIPFIAIDTSRYTNFSLRGVGEYLLVAEVGSQVDFDVTMSSAYFFTDGTPVSLTFEAHAYVLDSVWTGRSNPPFSSLPVLSPIAPQSGFTAFQNNNVLFTWYVTPDLLIGNQTTYYFTLLAHDNRCPDPYESEITVAIRVVPGPGFDLEDGLDAETVRLFPNPVAGELQIDHSQLKGQGMQVVVLDLHGQVLLKKEFDAGEPMTLNVDRLSPGVYLLRSTGDQPFIRQFTKL